MMGGVNTHFDCIKVFSKTDFTKDLKGVDVSVLVLHDEDEQIVPFSTTAVKAAQLLKNGKLITYPRFPHGMPTTETSIINFDFLDFIKS